MKIKIRMPFSIMVATLSFATQAAEYSVTPFASARAEADTNRRLVQNSDSNFGGVLAAGALFRASSEETTFSMTPSVSVRQFSDDGTDVDQDTEDYFLNARADHRINERFNVGAFVNYSNVGVVDSELEDLGITFSGGDIASTGFVLENENFSVERISAGPSLTYVMSEKNSFSFGGTYSEATYENQNTELSDYKDYSFDVSWIRQLSPTDQFIVSVFTSKNDPDLNALEIASITAGRAPATLNNEVDQSGVTIGYVRTFSDTLTGNFSIGMRKTKGDFPDLTDFDLRLSQNSAETLQRYTGNALDTTINRLNPIFDDNAFFTANPDFLLDAVRANQTYEQGEVDNSGLLLDVSLKKEYNDQTSLTLGISRASLPTGRGLYERSEISLGGVHKISDRLTGTGSLRYFSTEAVSEETLQVRNQSSDQIRFEAGLSWQMSEFWTVGGGYTFRWISPDRGDSANGHGAFVSVGYNGNKRAISR